MLPIPLILNNEHKLIPLVISLTCECLLTLCISLFIMSPNDCLTEAHLSNSVYFKVICEQDNSLHLTDDLWGRLHVLSKK